MKTILICLSPLFILFFMVALFFSVELFKGRKLPKGRNKSKRPSLLRRIYWDFPRALVNDMFNRNPDKFPDYGLHLICGEQGAGKTICLAYLLRDYQRRFPLVRVCTNFYYKSQDYALNSWKDLVFRNNGEHGEVDVLDEIQNWFSSNQSKDFPPEMIQEITQQRKQKKMIIGTAQVFGRVAKPIREQVNFLYLPVTLFGCLTVVRVYKPNLTDDGTIKKAKMRRVFFFVHDRDLRNSFDTYRKISMMAKDGFISRQWTQDVNIVNSDSHA